MEWISVLQVLPRAYEPVLVYVPGYNYPEMLLAVLTDVGSSGWQVLGGHPDQLMGFVVTHWMPLPDEPGQ